MWVLSRDNVLKELQLAIGRFPAGLNDSSQYRLDLWPAEHLVCMARHLDLSERVNLATVCSHIRFALLAEPSLWNTVSLRPNPDYHDEGPWKRAFNLFDHAKAGSERLHLSVRGAVHLTNPHVLRRLNQALDTVSTLFLEVQEPRSAYNLWTEEISRPICDLFSRPDGAPQLRRLQLVLPFRIIGPELPESFLGRVSGQLEECSVFNFRLTNGVVYGAFAELRTLTYFASRGTHMTAYNLRMLLDSMPRLETFGMASIHFEPGGADTLPFLCPRLGLVNLQDTEAGSASLMELFALVPKVIFILNRERDPALFATLPSNDVHMSLSWTDLRFSDDSSGLVQSTNGSLGRCRTFSFYRAMRFSNIPHNHKRFTILNDNAHRIVSLTLPEGLWEYVTDHLPLLPSLKDLAIVLGTCKDEREGLLSCGLFVDRLARPVTSLFPTLECLHLYSGEHLWKPPAECPYCAWFLEQQLFSLEPDEPREKHCSCLAGLTISLTDVTNFIQTLPLSHGHRLKKLILGGVRAVVDCEPAMAMAALLELVDEFDGVEHTPEKLVKFVLGELDYEALPRSGVNQETLARFRNTELEPSVRRLP